MLTCFASMLTCSLHLMSYLLPQLHFPSLASTPLFTPTHLARATVLELGSGTGLLAIALAPFVGRWVCTDQAECLKLIGSNLNRNGFTVGSLVDQGSDPSGAVDPHHVASKTSSIPAAVTSKPSPRGSHVGVEELDWFSCLPPSPTSKPNPNAPSTPASPPLYDLIVSSDCIYNPHLVPPLRAAFAHFARPNHTVVLVVIELRAVDVIREFLELWIEEGDGRWQIRRLVGNEDDAEGSGWGAGGGRFAGWIGWRTR